MTNDYSSDRSVGRYGSGIFSAQSRGDLVGQAQNRVYISFYFITFYNLMDSTGLHNDLVTI